MHGLRDQDLILYYYGETRDAERIRRRLEASGADRERYEELCRLLEMVEAPPVPEPDAEYGARVWRRLRPELRQPSLVDRLRDGLAALWLPRRLAAAGSIAMLVALAFTAGRYWPAADAARGLSAAGRERILLVSVGEHLERSEILLVELVNARQGALGAGDEPRRAEQLLSSNRLYRQAARRSGQPAIAEVLEELERLLLDVAHLDLTRGELPALELDELRERIEGGGILFKVQIVGSRLLRHNPLTRSPEVSGDV